MLSNYQTFKIRSEQIKSGRHRDAHGDFIDETPVPCGCCGPKPEKPMLDLDKLEDERRDHESEKAELFEFYHQNWPKVIQELREFQNLAEPSRRGGDILDQLKANHEIA